jgi:hypothetical protein
MKNTTALMPRQCDENDVEFFRGNIPRTVGEYDKNPRAVAIGGEDAWA